jgi:hypothetical protein
MCNGLQGLKWAQTWIAWDCEVWCVVLGLKLMKMCNKKQYIYFICTFMGMFYRSLFVLFLFGHCVVCSSSIYGFWLPLWYLQTLLWTVTTFCTKGSNKCPQFRNFVHKLMTLYSCLLPLSEKNNLIPYSIFDHLTSGGWNIFLFVKKKPRIE